MSNASKLDVGVIVVVVFVEDPDFSYLYGQVGTIVRRISGLDALLTANEWIVDFPNTRDFLCPNCGQSHGTRWPMRSIELRPLNDPDQTLQTQTEETQPIEEETTA